MRAVRATDAAGATCLIIGASKAGTTTLFDSLAQHPGIAAGEEKEIRYFSNDDRYARGAEWYGAQFGRQDDGRLRLDASPAYLTWSDKTAPRIRAHFGDARPRMVVILRDPVARAYSHYWHRVRLGHETLTFEDALACEDDRLRQDWTTLEGAGDGRFGYARASRYAERLRPFLDLFERDQFCFLLQEDLRPECWSSTMATLLAFLALDPNVSIGHHRANSPGVARNPGVVRLWNQLKATGARQAYRRLVPRAVRRAMPGLLFRPDTYPPLAPATAHRLRARFEDDVLQCQALIGRSLSHWLSS